MRATLVLSIFAVLALTGAASANSSKLVIGVYYFPGWRSDSRYYRDLKGLADSRSPGRPWPEREPLLGYYPEEETWVAERHIEWAKKYGISFFAYDWYWNGKTTYLEHAIKAHLAAKNASAVQFSLLWATEKNVPKTLAGFDAIVTYWIEHYLVQPTFYRVAGRPVIFILSPEILEQNAQTFGESLPSLLLRAQHMVKDQLKTELFFVAVTNERPSSQIAERHAREGFGAFSGWNYVLLDDPSRDSDYDSMVATYERVYKQAPLRPAPIPYVASASPGYDTRPWAPTNPCVRRNTTPEKFRRMLMGARRFLDQQKGVLPPLLMIEAWNEFGEGSYLEPTRQFGFSYLEMIRRVFVDGRD
jgi:hypothetical protein